MTDKQIIIDGVDVSGCKYYIADNGVQYNGCYELTDICECNKEDDFCDDNPNCYYKQLKAKEQVFNEIKEYFKSKDKTKTTLFNIFVIEQEILGIINKG